MVLGGLLPDTTAVHVFAVAVTSALIWLGSTWLEEAAEELSTYYGLPAVVQGSVVVALGSSFPEFASVVFTALADTFNMGVGAIVGSAIFNILVIPALSGIVTDAPLETDRTVVYKEAQFYMIAVSALVITFALAVIYFPASGSELAGEITRPLALLPLFVYALYLFIQWQDVGDYDAPEVTEEIPVLREWGRLAAGLLVILAAVEQLVGSVDALGQTLGVPEFLAGVVVLAGATSLPDTIVSVRTAKAGRSRTSIANVLGSNTFDLLVAIPVGVLIVGAVTVDFAAAVPMLGVLTLATVLLFTVLRTGLSMSRVESYALLGAYVVFVAWIAAETAGVTDFLKGG